MSFFDSHAHIGAPDLLEDASAMLERARSAGVSGVLAIGAGSGIGANAGAVAVADAHRDVWATTGVHPHDASEWNVLAERAIDGWLVHLAAKGREYADNNSSIGRVRGAAEQLDRYDNPEPPTMGGYVALVMDRPEWGARQSTFTSDIRSLDETDGIWDVRLRTKDADGPIALSYEFEGDFPAGTKVVLMDLQERQVYDLTAGDTPADVTGYSERYPYYLKIMAGSADYVGQAVDETLAQLPVDFALAPNYPNPFNPSTTLEFSLTRPAPVSLAIYDLLGKEIVTVFEGWRDYGNHTAVWDGRDRGGQSVATGIYFAVFRAEGRIFTRKMLLMK